MEQAKRTCSPHSTTHKSTQMFEKGIKAQLLPSSGSQSIIGSDCGCRKKKAKQTNKQTTLIFRCATCVLTQSVQRDKELLPSGVTSWWWRGRDWASVQTGLTPPRFKSSRRGEFSLLLKGTYKKQTDCLLQFVFYDTTLLSGGGGVCS